MVCRTLGSGQNLLQTCPGQDSGVLPGLLQDHVPSQAAKTRRIPAACQPPPFERYIVTSIIVLAVFYKLDATYERQKAALKPNSSILARVRAPHAGYLQFSSNPGAVQHQRITPSRDAWFSVVRPCAPAVTPTKTENHIGE